MKTIMQATLIATLGVFLAAFFGVFPILSGALILALAKVATVFSTGCMALGAWLMQDRDDPRRVIAAVVFLMALVVLVWAALHTWSSLHWGLKVLAGAAVFLLVPIAVKTAAEEATA